MKGGKGMKDGRKDGRTLFDGRNGRKEWKNVEKDEKNGI
jgi:hypothetical protein